MVSQDMRLGHIILASDDSRLKDQMQADAPVEKIGQSTAISASYPCP